MKLAIMQPYFFPYLGYFHLVKAVDKFVFYTDVNFIKQGWINRNRLLIDGRIEYFRAQLVGASSFKKINEINVPISKEWRTDLYKTIEHAYRKSPYKQEGLILLKEVLFSSASNIGDLASMSVKKTCDYLGLKQNFVDSTFYKNESLRSFERVLDICKSENANIYVNLSGGRALYSQDQFARINCELRFLKSTLRNYTGCNDFEPGLSILDIVMNCNQTQIGSMLEEYELIQ